MKKQIDNIKFQAKLIVLAAIFSLAFVFGLNFLTAATLQIINNHTSASAQEPADLNNDNTVNVFDLSILISNWNTNNTTADINKDGTVNIFDLSALISKWGTVVYSVQQFNVKDYGARGDNSANDTVKIQAAINAAAPVSGMVVIPSGTYLITQPLNVPANVTISGTGTIRQSSAGTYGLWIKGSNVTIDGIGLLGPNNNLTFVDPEYAIYGSGTVNTPLENITIKNTTISKWGAYGVRVEHLQNFTISGNTVTDIGYSGIGVLTARQGTIIGNTIDNITPGSDGNMYGIAMSFVGDEATSTDIVVRDNTVSRVAWECIDTHGGSRLTIDNNQLLSCGVGVAIVNGLIAERTSKDIVITNNYIDAQKDYYTSPKDVGIILQGFDDGSGGITPVTGRITGNTIRNVQVGVYYFETNGLEISNNNFEQCIGWGVFALRNNTNFRIINNNFKDMWSNSTWTAAIHTASSNGTNTGLISNNSLLRATKQATYINQYGYYYRGGMSGITVNNNNFAAATVAPIAGEP